jgi:adenylate cyclase
MTQIERAAADAEDHPPPAKTPLPSASDQDVNVRFFAEDGSVFLDSDYLIRGVAGRVLWSLVQRRAASGVSEFAIKELRLDKSLALPGFRDNLDTRLVLLKRRLEERQAPIQLERCGRGRFRMDVAGTLRLESNA